MIKKKAIEFNDHDIQRLENNKINNLNNRIINNSY